MIFHAPYPIDPNPTSASRLRPKRMLESFRAAGLRVHEVTGDPRDRAAGYRDARRLQRAGRTFELLYSENSTQPNVLATSIRRGVAPLLDARILAWAHRSRIPAGEFYRDIYWRFSTKLTEVRTPRSLLMQLAYRFDLEVLRRTGTHVFLPSLAMGPELPYPRDRFSALPPGTDVRESPTPSGVHLFYVGGLGADYGLHACVEAVSATPGVSLTLCVPERDWTANAAAYQGYLSDRIRVVHATSRELAPYYAQASACVLFVEPTPYRRFAAPVKFFEYLGYGKPILLSEGTLAGDMGAELGIGIPIAYTAEAFAAALSELQEDPQRLPALARRAEEVRSAHTWQARVQEAISVLRPELTEKLADHQPLSR
ncbi:glycosyl transferase family 1 [Brachybacterium phenoliresistens]|uniref:Glycosyl transferase family 1 n=2 Tax=Brachybacterium phenoliresistens TaxID=396014 RepID=Z9JQU1_9MICO|nr:glycosyl transferase family 1 [Brachybacterium phenoliresistens]